MKLSKELSFRILILFSCIFVYSFLLVLPVFGEEHLDSNMSSDSRPPHWDYLGVEGPEHWGMLTKEYRACETGNRQSPVNISRVHHGQGHDQLVFHYETSEIHELNNGHTIQVSHLSGCRVDLNQREYQLRQFHFHAPSEHHVEGKAFPMELHLVHQDDQGHVLVVSALMEATANHQVLGELWDWLPNQIGTEVSVPIRVHLTDILPKNTHHFSYSGSLTTPPCTEGVQWIVLQEPISVSQQDVDRFVKIIGYNARPVQPLGQRAIEEK